MPIKPELRPLYGADWREVSGRIRERAGHRCEWCGAPDGAVGYRDAQGTFHQLSAGEAEELALEGGRTVKIVITVAHLDRDPRNSDPGNLAALCQACHLRHDHDDHCKHAAETRRRKREEAGQMGMF